jgi:hypothetical protein
LGFSTFGIVEHHVKNGRLLVATLIQIARSEMFVSEVEWEDEVMKEIEKIHVCKLKKVEFQKVMKKS